MSETDTVAPIDIQRDIKPVEAIPFTPIALEEGDYSEILRLERLRVATEETLEAAMRIHTKAHGKITAALSDEWNILRAKFGFRSNEPLQVRHTGDGYVIDRLPQNVPPA